MLEGLNLNEEQTTAINKILEETTVKAKEGLFDEDTVNKKVQSETDKIRTEYSKTVKSLQDELAKLKPVEKSDAEKQLEIKLKELSDKETSILAKEKSLLIQSALSANGLPGELSKYLNGEDVEAMTKDVVDIFNNHIVANGFKPSGHKNTEHTGKNFKDMTYSERESLYTTNPTLYDQLSQQ